ncbi:MAG: MotA/TolQ/ExbB proton channel family protein [Myxococcales bacterium]|nr:MotA/TolQ/ExbB proton channel family protein [Myxococcales bacterium]
MDIATIIGIVLAFVLILGSIIMGNALPAFIDVPSMLIVFGGTIATTLTMERMENVVGALKVAKNAMVNPGGDVVKTVQVILELSATARRSGILELEKVQIEDPFLAKAIRMAVDGLSQEQIAETLRGEMVALRQRHLRGQKLFKFMADSAPAMGMIGTLIGLVQMLRALDDPSSIGPAMAVALLTTFYGAVIAFVICKPIAEKLERRTQEETANMAMVIEGVSSIVMGQNPAVIQEKLEALLPPKKRESQEAA